MFVEEQHKIDPELFVRPPSSQLGATGLLNVDSTGVVVSGKVTDENLHGDSTALPRLHLERSPALHNESYGGVNSNAGQPSKLILQDDENGSAARLQESSAHCVGEFVDKVRHELLSSKILMEKKAYETDIVVEEKHDQKSLVQYTSGGSQSKKHDTRHSNRDSSTQGPLNEMWRENEPSVEEPSKAELQEDAEHADNAIVKRTGRSLWNIIADIVQLRWSSRSKSQSTVGMTGGRSSPDQSTRSETWFCGHEAEENEEATGEKEMRSMTQEPISGIQQHEQESHSKFEAGSSSSTFGGHLVHAEINAASSVVLGSVSSAMYISLPNTEETSKTNHGSSSAAAVVEPSNNSPASGL